MPVIIRETRTISGKEYPNIKVFKSDRPLTKDGQKQAEELDLFLKIKMNEICDKLKKEGILKYKNKKGKVLELWWNLGKELTFVDNPVIVSSEDRKHIWRAMYDHAGELLPGKKDTARADRMKSNYFYYYYLIAKYPWKFVNEAGNWTAWVEFLDSTVIRNDERIINWLSEIQEYSVGSKQDWLRKLNKSIRNEFKNKDTTIFTNQELLEILKNLGLKISFE